MIKKQTLAKLKKVAEKVWKDGGIDYCNLTNFETYCYHIAHELDLHISPNTIRLHSPKIRNFMKELDFEAKLNSVSNVVVEQKEDLIVKITLHYSSGKVETFKKEVEPKPVDTNEPVLWTGLFDYNDGKVVVRRGKHTGANVRNRESIKKSWGSLFNFISWCKDRIDDVEKGRIIIMPDTEKDMFTLRSILKKLDSIF
jgi:hypothetical protein